MIKLNLKSKEYRKQKPATYDKQLDQIKILRNQIQ